ncbi:DUF2306 domain-containing protein [Thalassotalea euphylliae]|uniref:DUF2306 domain-containing protein n=1 Tax=Thalassotalea euphylliae TaxID=1655234 RepID=A0A3E0U2A8_9GAMM|nr:DUF2306 domain-containing protein [Thalassotalea euphylliae]REL30850.1 DUF2306 domain-containing protein [Thalassotalea euphylliae]
MRQALTANRQASCHQTVGQKPLCKKPPCQKPPCQKTTATIPFNWPVVSTLALLTAIPAIPAIFILLIVAIGAGNHQELAAMINSAYFDAPAAVYVHGGSGILFFLTMPWQFSPRLRHQYAGWHKIAGRIAVIAGCVMALSGIWMHKQLTPDEQGARYLILVVMSAAICLCFLMAVWHIVNRNIARHQRWMALAVAITLAAVTPLFTGLLVMLMFSSFDQLYPTAASLHHQYDRLLGMAINLAIVELVFRKKGMPS